MTLKNISSVSYGGQHPDLIPASFLSCGDGMPFEQVNGHGSVTFLLLLDGILFTGDNSGYLR